MRALRTISSLVLTAVVTTPGFSQPQASPNTAGPQKYQLTVVQNASGAKRVKKNRVSAEAVVQVTDQNNVPVAGIAVSFTIPQLVGGGASFSNGGLMSVAYTNAAGQASSGSFVTGGSFNMNAVASVPGGTVSASIPVNAASLLGTAAAGAAGGAAGGVGGGISTGLLVGIIAGAGAVAAVAAKVATGGKGTPPAGPASPTSPTSVGLGGATVGH